MEQFNATDDATTLGHCLHYLFEHAAEGYADNIALICDTQELSFRELNILANRLAHALAKRGVRRGDLVVVAMDRSIDLVVALLGVLKTGAAYVPVDISFPSGRINLMMDDANPRLVLSRDTTLDELSRWKDLCLSVDEIQNDSDAHDENLQVKIQPEDLAYIIYTSGSTGKPKGVEISHGAVSNFICSMRRDPGCDETDKLLAVTTVSFDIAVLELFLPLVCGATTVIAQAHQVGNASALLELMKRHAITMMQGTPATWQLLLDSGWPGIPRLTKILCGGEALSRRLASRLLACGDSVWNMYGPTEATVWASIWKVRGGDDDVVIGSPIANTQLYVLDADRSPVPLGCVGELYIGGAGVARGYHNNAELTRSRFLDNPFRPGTRLYQTGDLARFITPENLSVLGRTDDQVKIRGYRIELGDIETAITNHGDVSKAVVVSRDDRLVAYCVRESAQLPGGTQAAGVDEWAGAWDHVYGEADQDAVLNLAGWRSSYDDLPFSTDEMRDWQSSSVRRILSYAPERVVEIGSGTGLMLFSVAPYCSHYYATDASVQAIEFTRRHLTSLPHVVCEHREAHALPVIEGTVDTVIVNSVIQYFPSINYLVSLLEWAIKAVNQGRIYLGDVRNLALLDIFHGDVLYSRTGGQIPPAELASRAVEAARRERELVISPDFFANLPTMFPQITHVDIVLRDGLYDNEMTRYRFDVTLHIGEGDYVPILARELNWRDNELDLASLRDTLAVAKGNVLRLNNIPNGRLRDVYSRLGGALGTIAYAGSSWVDPEVLKGISTESNLEMELLPSRSDAVWSFDAVFWHAGETPDLIFHPPEPIDERIAEYANVPKVGEASKSSLSRLLRPWLAERLPAYMMPTFFVELDEFPLTLNGKINRRALPDPVASIEVVAMPATELERDISSIWSDILGHDRIDINDNFFQIGGDSLRVVRVQKEIERLVGRPVPSAILFEHYTIKTLAAHLATNKPNPEPTPIHHPVHYNEDIAIISMACRIPGGITTPEEYWELLENGGDAITDVPEDRWNADAIYDPNPEASGKSYCRQGGFMSVDSFDAAFFGISPREVQSLDPMQYIMLETCWEALERAGYTNEQLRGSQTGVYIGISSLPAYNSYPHASKNLEDLDGYAGTGSAGATISGRVSYFLGVEGPTMTVDTACSSSLVTTHLACTALRQGECDIAVSGGISLLLSPGVHVEFSRLRGMAPDGRCRAFAANTQGTGWSEGSAAVVLKRLSDAHRDNDQILAVLRGSAVNHGGRSASLTTPSGPAQKRLIRTAIAASGLQPGDIDYIEAHGTGTRLGDPIEGAALAEVFGSSSRGSRAEPLWVGSAKSNLGHTQAAAGLVGVLKVVLAMQHGILPQTLHVNNEPTPAVDWKGANMALVQERQPWLPRKDRLRRAGVSAFGIGGTNAHVIVQEAPKHAVRSSPLAPLPPVVPLVISGNTDAALSRQAEKLRLHLSRRTDRLGDVAYSLATARSHFRRRLALMAHDKEEALEKLAAVAIGTRPNPGVHAATPRLVMLFTGQGSQVAGMGKDLARNYPVFREALDEIMAQFVGLDRPLLDVMWADTESDSGAGVLLQHTDYAQPALFAFEVALWRLWTSWGVWPDLLFGHSIGELAVAHVAGVMDLADACRLVAARGRLMAALDHNNGRMMSLEASVAEVRAAIENFGLGNKVSIASHNGPTQTVASGDGDAIEKLGAYFTAQNRRAKTLKVSHAFHSHHMDGMLADFQSIAETVRFHPPTSPIVSGLTGQLATPGLLEKPGYWVQQARNAVRFSDGIQTLASQGINIALELGPQPVLCGMGTACLAGNGVTDQDINTVAWLPSVVAKQDAASVIQNSLAELHVRHVSIDWVSFFKPFGCQRVELPTYAFQRERILLDAKPRQWKMDTSTISPDDTANQSPKQAYWRWDLRDALMDATSVRQAKIMQDMVRETVAGILGFTSPDAVDAELPLRDLGIDSLTAALLWTRLATLTSLALPAMVAFDHPNLRALSQYLLNQLQESWKDASTTTQESDDATPTTAASTSPGDISVDNIPIIGTDSVAIAQHRLVHWKKCPNLSSIAPLYRVLSPPLGLNPPNTSSQRFLSALGYFSSLPWCSRLIYDSSPMSGLLPGYGQAIPFIPQCFNPASLRHDQFIGNTLSHDKTIANSINDTNGINHNKSASRGPPLRHMLSLIRPSDASHLEDATRHIPRVASLYALGDGTSGFEGILHGGLTTTLLDESLNIVHEINTALGKTCGVFAGISVTASLNVRFVAPVATTEEAICVTAWVEEIRGRYTTLKAELTNGEGDRLAEAEGVFAGVESSTSTVKS